MRKILPVVIIVLFTAIFYLIYTKATTSAKVKRIECQAQTTTFEKIFVEDPIKEGINAFLNGNYEIKSGIEYSKSMPSNLKNLLSLEDLDNQLSFVINKYKKDDKTEAKKVLINYYLYENDKADLNKKNDEAKRYPGYLMFDFKYDNKLIYKIQTDYQNIDASDLPQRLDCVIKSFISIKGEK